MGEIASLIIAIAALISAFTGLGAFVVGLRNRQGIKDIKKATDGLTSKLVDETRVSATAEGLKQGRAEATDREKVSREDIARSGPI